MRTPPLRFSPARQHFSRLYKFVHAVANGISRHCDDVAVFRSCESMPNQYTKFKTATQNSSPLEFRWREYTGKKAKRPRGGKKTIAQSETSSVKSSSSDGRRSGSLVRCTSVCSPTSSLLRYLPSGGLRIDPFRAYPVAPDHSELAVLDHCTFGQPWRLYIG